MQSQAAELIGGDLQFRDVEIPDQRWLDRAAELGLKTNQWVQFLPWWPVPKLPALGCEGGPRGLAAKGRTEVTDQPFGDETPAAGRSLRGEVWVDPQLALELQLVPGDTLEVGAAELTLTQILAFEPDRGGGFYSLQPRVLMNRADLKRAEVIRPGARVRYYQIFDGPQWPTMKAELEAALEPQQRLRSGGEGGNAFGDAMKRATSYLRLGSLLAIIVAASVLRWGPIDTVNVIRQRLHCYVPSAVQSRRVRSIWSLAGLTLLGVLGGRFWILSPIQSIGVLAALFPETTAGDKADLDGVGDWRGGGIGPGTGPIIRLARLPASLRADLNQLRLPFG